MPRVTSATSSTAAVAQTRSIRWRAQRSTTSESQLVIPMTSQKVKRDTS